MNFPDLPHKPSISVEKWKCHVPQQEVDRMIQLIQLAPPARRVFETSGIEKDLGMTADFLERAKKYWVNEYDWRKTEDSINEFSNYKAAVPFKNSTLSIHFMALISERKDAIPLIMMHGWAGSFMEFLPLLRHLSKKHTPSDLPVHIIIPSLPGYGFSDAAPPDVDFDTLDSASVMDGLMRGLGFDAYVAQGGDIGSFNARLLAERFDACKGVHVNLFAMTPPPDFDMSALDELDQKNVQRMVVWRDWERSYLHSQALKPGTTGLALDSSPVAVLSWIGEKLVSCEFPFPLILDTVSLYFLTQTSTSSLYPYRTAWGRRPHTDRLPDECKHKPVGYSQFPREIIPTPIPWVKAKTNLVYAKRHDKGGHFAALQQHELLWEDVTEFLKIAWKPEMPRSSL